MHLPWRVPILDGSGGTSSRGVRKGGIKMKIDQPWFWSLSFVPGAAPFAVQVHNVRRRTVSHRLAFGSNIWSLQNVGCPSIKTEGTHSLGSSAKNQNERLALGTSTNLPMTPPFPSNS